MGNVGKKKTYKPEEDRFIRSEEHSINEDYDKLSSNNFKEYFRLVKTRLRQFYDENHNSNLNVSLALDEKSFSSMSVAKRISINPNQKFIHWKDYIINYLNKQSTKGYQWAESLNE
jgi:hypothetical protein